MRIVKTYNSFNEEKIVNDIINYIDYSINEGVDIESIWNKAVNKIKNLSEEAKRKVIKYVLVSLLAFNTFVNVSNLVTSSYIASFCVGEGGGSFDFEPLNDVAISSSVFRGTGGISIGVGEGVVSYILTEDGDFLITEDGNNLIQ